MASATQTASPSTVLDADRAGDDVGRAARCAPCSMVRTACTRSPGSQRRAVAKSLVAVHDPAERQPQLRVSEHGLPGGRRDHRGEGGRRDRRGAEVRRVVVAEGAGELGDLGRRHLVRRRGRIAAAGVLGRDGHGRKPNRADSDGRRTPSAPGSAGRRSGRPARPAARVMGQPRSAARASTGSSSRPGARNSGHDARSESAPHRDAAKASRTASARGAAVPKPT